ncbi:MAG: hypothetical protein HYR83_06735 [Planctomycetes bacterium]|nr:hypothetical protein [Planctomycetota bacterium]
MRRTEAELEQGKTWLIEVGVTVWHRSCDNAALLEARDVPQVDPAVSVVIEALAPLGQWCVGDRYSSW